MIKANSEVCFIQDQPLIPATLLFTSNKTKALKYEINKKKTPLLGKRLRKELNQISSSADFQTDESQDPTNESSFNRLSDGSTSTKFTIQIAQLSETKSENQLVSATQESFDQYMAKDELKCLKQHNSEVFSDGASVNDSYENWDIAIQLSPEKRRKMAILPASDQFFKVNDEDEKKIKQEANSLANVFS